MPIKRLGRSKRVMAWTRFYRKYVAFTQKRKWIYYVLLVLAFGIPFHALPDRWDKEKVYYQSEEEEEAPWYERAYNATFGTRFFPDRAERTVEQGVRRNHASLRSRWTRIRMPRRKRR